MPRYQRVFGAEILITRGKIKPDHAIIRLNDPQFLWKHFALPQLTSVQQVCEERTS